MSSELHIKIQLVPIQSPTGNDVQGNNSSNPKIPIYCENHTKYTDTLCGQSFNKLKVGGT
jgi:hypothetical protein